MSGVVSLQAAGSSVVSGAVTLTSTQPGLLTLGSSGTNISFAPVSAFVNTINGKNGNPVLTSLDSTLTINAPVLGTAINLSGSTATSGLANITNLTTTNAGAWVSATAYPKGSTAFSVAAPTDLYIARQSIVSSTTDPASDPTNWVKLATTATATPTPLFTATTAVANINNITTTNGGAWVSGSAYDKGSTVFSLAFPEELYIARQAIASSTVDPSADLTDWVKLATKSGYFITTPVISTTLIPASTPASAPITIATITTDLNSAYRVSFRFSGANPNNNGHTGFSIVNVLPALLNTAGMGVYDNSLFDATYNNNASTASCVFNSGPYTSYAVLAFNTGNGNTQLTVFNNLLVEKIGLGFDC
jgi:hypothetical protein